MSAAVQAVAVITRLRSRGISVRLEERRLFAIGPADERLAASDRAALRALRFEIIRLLQQEAEPPEPGTFDGPAPYGRRARQPAGSAPVRLGSSWPDPGSWQYVYATTGQHPLWCATCRGRTRRRLADGSVGCPRCARN